jgi:flagellar capping protein FliD
MSVVDEVRKAFQDFVAPDIKSLSVRLDAVDQRLDRVEKHVDQRFTDMQRQVDQRFDDLRRHIDSQFDSLRYDLRLNERVSAIESRLREQESKQQQQ